MDKGQRFIGCLLAVIAALLAVNVFAKTEQRAEAGVQRGDGEPYVVRYLVRTSQEYYRIWSDGQIDVWGRAPDNCNFTFVGIQVDPVVYPFPVVAADVDANVFILEFADGRVDHYWPSGLRCTIVGEGGEPFCRGDVDRNGATNFDDLLFVLRDWGVCEN